jgi:hypothetical protein
MHHRSFGSFILWAIGLSALCLVGFAALRWLGVPAGRLLDWVIGIATAWWLLVIVTIPWNIHFAAREVVAEVAESRRRGLLTPDDQARYAAAWVGRSLLLALGLHLASAGALYGLAVTGVSAIGYPGSVAALLLTGLRPAVRGYEYVAARLAAIGSQARYPREDAAALAVDLRELVGRVEALERAADPELHGSPAATQRAERADQARRLDELRLRLDELRAANAAEHARLAREAEQGVARISADGQVIDHVRELVRFFKSA